MLLGFEIFFLDLNDNHFSVYCAHTHSKHKDMLLTLEAVSYCVITSFINLHTACMHTVDTKSYTVSCQLWKLSTLEAVNYCVITSFINLHTACMHTIDTKLYCKLLTLEAVNSVAVNSTITFGLCVFNLI